MVNYIGEFATSCGSLLNANTVVEQFYLVRNIVCMVIPGIVIIATSTAVIITRCRSLQMRRSVRRNGGADSGQATQNTQVK